MAADSPQHAGGWRLVETERPEEAPGNTLSRHRRRARTMSGQPGGVWAARVQVPRCPENFQKNKKGFHRKNNESLWFWKTDGLFGRFFRFFELFDGQSYHFIGKPNKDGPGNKPYDLFCVHNAMFFEVNKRACLLPSPFW